MAIRIHISQYKSESLRDLKRTMKKNSTFDFFIIEQREYFYCKIEVKGCLWLTCGLIILEMKS